MHQLFHSTQTWTFTGRPETATKSNQKSLIPGPGHYSSNKITNRAPTFCIGTEERTDPFKVVSTTPGPGSHDLKSHIDDGPKRSMSAKHDLRYKVTPGPTDYDADILKTKKKQPLFSMSTRSKDLMQITRDSNMYKPAPNFYNAKGSFSNPKGVIGTSKRRDLAEAEKTPGPGHYLSMDQLQKTKRVSSFAQPRCSIGSNLRKTDINPHQDKTPGPGTYQYQSLWDDNHIHHKGYTMRPMTADLLMYGKSRLPGPGHYDESNYLTIKKRSPGYTCGSNKRLTFMDQATRSLSPGPGTNEVDPNKLYRSTIVYKFGQSNRKDLNQHKKTPGPSHYTPRQSTLNNKAPSFAPTRDRRDLTKFLLQDNGGPGPQAYDPRYALIKQSSTMSQIPHEQRPNFNKAKLTPGPGYYNLEGKVKGPTWKFPNEKRLAFTYNKESSKIPSSGNYEIRGMIPNPPNYMTTSNYKSKMTASTRGFRTTR